MAIVVLDVVGSERLLRSLGDERFGEVLDGVKDIAWWAMERHGGVLLADTGDGAILGMRSVCDAVRYCLEVRDETRLAAVGCELQIRYGVHFGQVVRRRHGFVGLAIYEAVDLGDNAEAGHVWVSSTAAREMPAWDGDVRRVVLPRSGAIEIVDLGDGRPVIDLRELDVEGALSTMT